MNLHNRPTCVKFGIVSCILEIRLKYFKTNIIGNTSSKEDQLFKIRVAFQIFYLKTKSVFPNFFAFSDTNNSLSSSSKSRANVLKKGKAFKVRNYANAFYFILYASLRVVYM